MNKFFHDKVKDVSGLERLQAIQVMKDELNKLENDEKRKQVLAAKDETGNTLFHTAAACGLDHVCQFMYEYGVDLETTNNAGHTPLFTALGVNQDIKLGKWLLDHGADPTVSIIDKKSTWTVFHVGFVLDNEQVMRLLVKYGANPTIPFKDGTVPLMYAKIDEKRELLCELSRRYNRRVEKLGAYCSWCGKQPNTLKRCKSCYVVFYCDVDCQQYDWKFTHSKSCRKPIICGKRLAETMAKAKRKDYVKTEPYIYLKDATLEQELSVWKSYKKALRKAVGKHFVVALQVYEHKYQTIIVYNQDHSIHTKVFYNCDHFDWLRHLLFETSKKQVLFLWATPCDPDNGTLFVYPGKPAPQQPWNDPVIEIRPFDKGEAPVFKF